MIFQNPLNSSIIILHDSYYGRASAHHAKGNLDDAIKDYKEAIRIKPDFGLPRLSLVNALVKLGRRSEANEQMKLIRPLMQKENEYNQACLESTLGNIEKALQLLKIALEKRPIRKQLAKQDPDLENIRDDPRFKELIGE